MPTTFSPFGHWLIPSHLPGLSLNVTSWLSSLTLPSEIPSLNIYHTILHGSSIALNAICYYFAIFPMLHQSWGDLPTIHPRFLQMMSPVLFRWQHVKFSETKTVLTETSSSRPPHFHLRGWCGNAVRPFSGQWHVRGTLQVLQEEVFLPGKSEGSMRKSLVSSSHSCSGSCWAVERGMELW